MKNNLPEVWMYGGGRQSVMIAVLIVQGKLPAPEIACVADTGREKSGTWEYLEKHVQPALDKLGVTIHRVSKEKYATVDLYGGKDKDTLLIPAFTNLSGKVSKLETFCSNEWKARVCHRWLGKEMHVKKYIPWFGFSVDEPRRFTSKRRSLGDNVRFPLADDFPTTKMECLIEVRAFGWPEPKHSACWNCPLQSDYEWLQNSDSDQAKAIQLDREIRQKDPNVFLHRSCVPLDQVKFKHGIGGIPKDPSQMCDEGLCFV